MKNANGETSIVKKINIILWIPRQLSRFKQKLNQRMEGKYSSRLIAAATTSIASLLMIIMLFVPNYLGVAGDQNVGRVMNAAGVYYTETAVDEIYNNYFVRTYSNVLVGQETADEFLNSQVLLVRIAVFIDNIFTGDRVFDIRCLAMLYGILYVPALYVLVKQACSRVKKFSEGFVIGFVGLLIFADVAYITYFNSFYPEALWFISLMYCVGAGLSFQKNRSGLKDFGALAIIVIFAIVLLTSRGECAFLGIVFAVFCLRLIFARREWMWGVICVMTAFILSIVSITCMLNMKSDYDETSKFHAMTRGVLFEADDPSGALEEFGISTSYELLADTSIYDFLPVIESNNKVLKEEFLDKYTYMDVAAYYLRHPGSFVNLMDLSIKSCFGIRREYYGNYEQSVGLPAQAKSIFWGMWSTFKSTSAPQTIGFFLVLVGAVVLLFGRGYSIRLSEDRRSTVFLDMLLVVVLVCVLQSGNTIIHSGDAEMAYHCFLVAFGMDIIFYYVFAELVHKINIF